MFMNDNTKFLFIIINRMSKEKSDSLEDKLNSLNDFMNNHLGKDFLSKISDPSFSYEDFVNEIAINPIFENISSELNKQSETDSDEESDLEHDPDHLVIGGSGSLKEIKSDDINQKGKKHDVYSQLAQQLDNYHKVISSEPDEAPKIQQKPQKQIQKTDVTEHEELQLALAMIAQMEGCEKSGEDYVPDPSFDVQLKLESVTKQLPDGTIYLGTVDGTGVPHGNGVLMDDTFSRNIYEGEFNHGYKHGMGTFHLDNGYHYTGNFNKENFHGWGQYFNDPSRMIGRF